MHTTTMNDGPTCSWLLDGLAHHGGVWMGSIFPSTDIHWVTAGLPRGSCMFAQSSHQILAGGVAVLVAIGGLAVR
jgi:hypothetical protein